MDALDFIRCDVADMGVTYEVHRETSEDGYDTSLTHVDDVNARVFSPSSAAQVVTEGVNPDVSMIGLVVPDTKQNGEIIHHVREGDQLRREGKRYDVMGKDGIPSDFEAELFRLALQKSSQSS